jgi:hypothetical protein
MSRRTSKITLLAAAAIAVAPLAAAEAHVFSFDFTGSPNDVMAVITTSNTIDHGGFDITSITGTVSGTDGGSIRDLVPTTPRATVSWNYDNIFFTGTPHLDNDGILFDAGSFRYNLYSTSPTTYFLSSNSPAGNYAVGQSGIFGVVASSVPEPSVWAMLLLGFGGLGFVACREKRRGLAFAAA